VFQARIQDFGPSAYHPSDWIANYPDNGMEIHQYEGVLKIR